MFSFFAPPVSEVSGCTMLAYPVINRLPKVSPLLSSLRLPLHRFIPQRLLLHQYLSLSSRVSATVAFGVHSRVLCFGVGVSILVVFSSARTQTGACVVQVCMCTCLFVYVYTCTFLCLCECISIHAQESSAVRFGCQSTSQLCPKMSRTQNDSWYAVCANAQRAGYRAALWTLMCACKASCDGLCMLFLRIVDLVGEFSRHGDLRSQMAADARTSVRAWCEAHIMWVSDL
jgi:hypothetical protein